MVVHWPSFESADGILLFQAGAAVYALYADFETIIAGGRDGFLYIGQLAENGQPAQKLRIIALEAGSIFDIKHEDGAYWIACESGVIFKLDEALNVVEKIQLSNKSIRCIHFKDNKMYAGASDGKIYVLPYPYTRVAEAWHGHQSSVFALAQHSKGELLSTGRDARIIKWSDVGEVLEEIPAHRLTIHSLASNSHGLLASGSMDKQIRIWDNASLTLLKVIDAERYDAHRNCVNKVLWIDSNRLISCADDRTIMVFAISKS